MSKCADILEQEPFYMKSQFSLSPQEITFLFSYEHIQSY
jgi:hypothetical protein